MRELSLWRDQVKGFTALAAISYADTSQAAVIVNNAPAVIRPAVRAARSDAALLLRAD
jgi:hypothetical protein